MQSSDLWQLSTSACGGDRESLLRRGNQFQIANGYMGYRGTLDEFGPTEAVGITLAGLFDQVGDAWREPVNAPNGGFTTVTLDGVELSALRLRQVQTHTQTLHFADARFERRTVFRARGKTLTFTSERFLSAAAPNLALIRFRVECDRAANVSVRTGIDGHIWDLNGPHLPDLQASRSDEVLVLQGRTHEQGKQVVVAEALLHAEQSVSYDVSDRQNLRVLTWRIEPGRVYEFTKCFAVYTDHDAVDGPLDAAAVRTVRRAAAAGFEACLAAHRAVWRKTWERSDVLIEGDDVAQHALRYSLLQLLMVAPVTGSAQSIPARALSGQVYKGAIFWDTEMFMLPFFLHTDPAKAAELLRYRIRTLDGARRKARSEGTGHRGAFYAWESQETGDDACSYFNVGDPLTGRELRTHFRDKQIHISGDVAIAIWRYFQVTGDDTLLLEGGAEVILECARFYADYAYFKPDRQRFELLDVIGPDEYHERVHNNAFTNQVAQETFAIANAVVVHLRANHPRVWRSLRRRLDIGAELAGFRAAEQLLYVPAPDPATGLIEQFDGYFKLRDTTVDALKALKRHPNEYLGASQGLAVPTQIIKQADVVMMLNLFKDRYDASVKRANWEYYEPRTEHGSSLSACAYAMVATEFGDLDFAYTYFLKTAQIDLVANYKVYAGTVFMGGSHPAANGGAWMTAVLGFAGLQADAQRIVLRPRLPRGWAGLRFRVTYRGDGFAVRLTPESVQVQAAASNCATHTLELAGRFLRCRPGQTVNRRTRRHVGAAVPDYDECRN